MIVTFKEFINEGWESELWILAYDCKNLADFKKRAKKEFPGSETLNLEKVYNDAKKAMSEDNKSKINNKKVYEGLMSELYIIADESKNEKDFIKNAIKAFPVYKNDKEAENWLKEIYKEAKNEMLNFNTSNSITINENVKFNNNEYRISVYEDKIGILFNFMALKADVNTEDDIDSQIEYLKKKLPEFTHPLNNIKVSMAGETFVLSKTDLINWFEGKLK